MNTTPIIHTITNSSGIIFHVRYYDDENDILWYNKTNMPKNNCLFCNYINNINNHEDSKNSFYINDKEHSLFNGHHLLIAKEHGGESILGRMKLLFTFISENDNITLICDGNKNTSPRNYHFTSHVLDKSINLPIKEICFNPQYYTNIYNNDGLEIGKLTNYGRGGIILKSKSKEKLVNKIYDIEKLNSIRHSGSKAPYLNIYIWYEEEYFCLIIIPRVIYKTGEYYNKNNAWNTAIGSLEIGGLFLMTNKNLAEHVSANLLKEFCSQVSFSDTHINEIIKDIY